MPQMMQYEVEITFKVSRISAKNGADAYQKALMDIEDKGLYSDNNPLIKSVLTTRTL